MELALNATSFMQVCFVPSHMKRFEEAEELLAKTFCRFTTFGHKSYRKELVRNPGSRWESTFVKIFQDL